MIDDPWFPRLAQNDALASLGAASPDPDFLKSCLEVCRQAGAYYALPYVGNSGLFFYRQDLFGKYGLYAPDTLSGVVAAPEKNGAGAKMYGDGMPPAAGRPRGAPFPPLRSPLLV